MKRPLHIRATALLWALAFVLGTVGEGFGLHPCPHHDNAGDAAHAAAHHDVAGHETPRAQDADCAGHHDRGHGESHRSDDGHDGPCTCGSACQAAAGAALPADLHSPAEPITLREHRTIPAAASVPVASRPPYFLPFAQAPPRRG